LSLVSLAQGSDAPYTADPLHVTVIRNSSDWSTFWNWLYSRRSVTPTLPSVDFGNNVVVAALDAQKMTGGYSVTITSVVPTSSGVTVNVSEVSPGAADIVTAALTQPFYIVAVPAFSGDATLVASQSPAAVNLASFQTLAKTSACTDFKNNLFLIDGTSVLWDYSGNCPDAGYATTLYGNTPADVQCYRQDSIAGPLRACPMAGDSAIFATIVSNLDKPDLGLGQGHTVQQISF
jgi:hypothetical protein